MVRDVCVVFMMLLSANAVMAAEKHRPKHDAPPRYQTETASDRTTSRQKIIDAAQVYCEGGTPFDRVHGFLRDFWQDADDQPQQTVTCKKH